jgi:hypothetical protein
MQTQKLIGLPIIIILLSLLTGQLSADESTVQRFMKEAPNAWREAIQAYDETTFSLEKRSSISPEQVSIFNCFQRVNDVRVEQKLESKGRTLFAVKLANRYYAASAGDMGNGKTLLSGAEPRIPSNPKQSSNSIIDYSDIRPSLFIGNIYLPEAFVGVGDFPKRMKIGYLVHDAISEFDINGAEVVVLKIEISQKIPSGEFLPINTKGGFSNVCTLKLAPARNWCAVEFLGPIRIRDGEKVVEGTLAETVEFESGGFHPKRKSSVMKLQGTSQETRTDYSIFTPANKPDDFYSVTSLGFPELDQFFPKRSSAFWYLAVIGLTLTIAGYFWGKRRKGD